MKGYDILIDFLIKNSCPYEYGLDDFTRNDQLCENDCRNDFVANNDKSKCTKCWQMAMEKEY